MILCGICHAIGADAFHLDRGGFRAETSCCGRLIDRYANAAVAHLEDPAAGCADEELGGVEAMMRMTWTAAFEHVGAADEGGEALDLMHQALRSQEFQRPVDGRRGRGAAILPQPIEKVIGARWTRIVENEPEYESSLVSQPQLAPVTEGFGLIKQAFGLGCECDRGHRSV